MKKGFTLVELIIAVAIGMIMTGMGVVSLNNFNAKQEIKSTKTDLVALLRQARNYAKTQQTPTGFTGVYKGVEFLLKKITFDVSLDVSGCLTNCFYTDNKDITPNGITIGSSSQNLIFAGWLIFSPYEGKLLNGQSNPMVPMDTDVTFTISSSKVGDTETVVVNKLGQIDGQ